MNKKYLNIIIALVIVLVLGVVVYKNGQKNHTGISDDNLELLYKGGLGPTDWKIVTDCRDIKLGADWQRDIATNDSMKVIGIGLPNDLYGYHKRLAVSYANPSDYENCSSDVKEIISQQLESEKVIPPLYPNITQPMFDDVVSQLKVAETVSKDTVLWKEYTSQKFGIKFRYPATFFIVEGNLPEYGTGVDAVYAMRLFQDTPLNHLVAENSPEAPSDTGPFYIVYITTSSIKGEFIASKLVDNYGLPLKWKEITFKNNKAIAEMGMSSMLGSDDYPFDALKVAKGSTLYNFSIVFGSLDDLMGNKETKQIRDNYYKILSTLEFIK